MQFEDLRAEVGAWSGRNFGDQDGLREVAPMLGIIEEIGELIDSEIPADTEDAFADMVIFLADLCERAGLQRVYIPPTIGDAGTTGGCRSSLVELMAAASRMCHIVLKRRQKIRGYQNDAYYKSSLWDAVQGFVGRLRYAYRYNGTNDLDDTVTKVWEKVKRRDWNKARAAEAVVEEPIIPFGLDADNLLPPYGPFPDPMEAIRNGS